MEQRKNHIKLGRFLCLVLRHHPEAAGIILDKHGWADVRALLDGVCSTGRQIDRETLERIVREDNKQRYSFNENHTKIRAIQDIPRNGGHFLPVIQTEGIRRMNRQYVHLSPDYQTAVAVGRRHGSPVVVLRIEAGAMAQNGMAFFRSENGVWLCEYVPPEYFCVVGDNS